MIAKKVLRYYSDCGRGFWKKDQAIRHDENCKCWKNPKFKTCISCKYKNMVEDSNGMEHEPQFLQTYQNNRLVRVSKGKYRLGSGNKQIIQPKEKTKLEL